MAHSSRTEGQVRRLAKDYMLSTIDNPYHPFTHYDEWYAWDAAQGYDTPSYLGRVVRTSFGLSDADQDDAIDMAIDEILEENILGIYIKVTEETKIPGAQA